MRADLIPLLGSWLLTYLVHSTLLLVAAGVLTRRLAQAAALRDLLWKVAMIGGLATASVQTGLGFEPFFGGWSLERFGGAAASPAGSGIVGGSDSWAGVLLPTPAPAAAAAPMPATTATPRAAGSELHQGEAASTAALPPSAGVSPEVPAGRWTGWLTVVVTGWGMIAATLSVLYLVQRARAIRRIGPRRQVSDVALLDMLDGLRRAGNVRRVVRLTAAPGLASPVALGRAEIVLPEAALTDLEPEHQRSMLAHELAHLERRDPAWLALACLLERVLFVQPLNRLARIRMQEAAELLCDDWAVHRTGSGVSLAACLVKVAEWVDTAPRPIPLAGMAERRSQLVTRIHRLIEGRVMPAAPRSLWFVAGAALLVGVTALAAPSITAQGTAMPTSAASTDTTPDTTDSWRRYITKSPRLARWRGRIEARRAMAEARATVAAAPRAPLPPRPPTAVPPAVAPKMSAEMTWALSAARAPFALPGKRDGVESQDTNNIAVPALIAALKDENVEVRRAAARSLPNLRDRRAVPALIEALRDPDTEVRMAAADGLGEFDDPRAVAGLGALLKDASKEVRRAALSALDDFADQVPDETILTALNDSDSEVRMAALSLAGNRISSQDHDTDRPADPRYVAAFSRLLADPDADVRQQAASAMGEARLREAPQALVLAARDKNPDVRQQVASALGEIQDPRTVGTLRELMQDPNPDVRHQAVQSLSEIRDRSALEALVTALKSSDPVVRRSAAEALGQRGSEKE